MLRRLGVALALVALVAAGCSSDSSSSGRRTVTVNVDGKTDAFNGGFIAYYPKDITVRQGDTVDFKSIWTGEPHTVTMGTLVDQGLAEAEALGPDAQEEPPTLQKIPDLIPDGPGNANQSSAQPCFLATGDPPGPGQTACSKAQQSPQPDFDGTQTYFNSGFLPADAVFKVKLASDIKPGTYQYFCALHRTEQTGKITVVESDGTGQTATEVTQAGQADLDAAVAPLTPIAQALKTGALPPFIPEPVPGQVIAGGGAEDSSGAINEFGPNNVSIAVGDSVTWPIIGPHTISFNSPVAPGDFITKAPDGSVNLNPAAFTAAGGPGAPEGPPPDTGPPPEGPPPPPTVYDGGPWDGTGFRNSGIFLSFPPQLSAFKLTFSKAGTYSYICIIHPGMVGTITVA